MALYKQLNLETKLLDILADVDPHDPGHHFGKPFMTPYQVAIFFKEKYQAEFDAIGKPFGGEGTGQHDSFVQYLAQILTNISKQDDSKVEGAFLSRSKLSKLEYKGNDTSIKSSLGTTWDLTMFRLKK